jgi:uncharacterized protein DUF1524
VRSRVFATALACGALLVGCQSALPQSGSSVRGSAVSGSAVSSVSGATTAAASATLTSSALALLATFAVKGRAPMTGYSRAQFGPAWPSVDGCDARNEVLRRDLTDVVLRDSCIVSSGTLVSPYSGSTIHFVRGPNSADVQIDHVVALGDAWQTGAQQWSARQRETFANDPAELLAVDARSNEQKGDSDAASWLPANKSFRCGYVTAQLEVKAKYRLWVTKAEHDAIAGVLSKCG